MYACVFQTGTDLFRSFVTYFLIISNANILRTNCVRGFMRYYHSATYCEEAEGMIIKNVKKESNGRY